MARELLDKIGKKFSEREYIQAQQKLFEEESDILAQHFTQLCIAKATTEDKKNRLEFLTTEKPNLELALYRINEELYKLSLQLKQLCPLPTPPAPDGGAGNDGAIENF